MRPKEPMMKKMGSISAMLMFAVFANNSACTTAIRIEIECRPKKRREAPTLLNKRWLPS